MIPDEASAIRNDLANIGQGLHALLGAIGNLTAIVSAVHEELSKDPPPSKIPAALQELTDSIRSLEDAVRGSG